MYRDSLFTTPQFDFYFKIALPKVNKGREIAQRDYLGRIIHSKPPGTGREIDGVV